MQNYGLYDHYCPTRVLPISIACILRSSQIPSPTNYGLYSHHHMTTVLSISIAYHLRSLQPLVLDYSLYNHRCLTTRLLTSIAHHLQSLRPSMPDYGPSDLRRTSNTILPITVACLLQSFQLTLFANYGLVDQMNKPTLILSTPTM